MHPSLRHTAHRPWPLPQAPWIWRQAWLDLGFLHFRMRPADLADRIPAGLRLETFDNSAWISVVPFRMADVMRRPLPSFPPFSSFPELNLRTYVTDGRKPGVWFFSLDADCRPVVWGGRHVYQLPYHLARMRFGADWRERLVSAFWLMNERIPASGAAPSCNFKGLPLAR